MHQRGSVSPQETSIPEELMVTVVKPGLPTLADLHVLLPPPRPTRKRSLSPYKTPILPFDLVIELIFCQFCHLMPEPRNHESSCTGQA